MGLAEYRAKRNFGKTPEPGPRPGRGHKEPIFVIQEHQASRLHYDFRLEADGVLKSWAVPKQPTMDPAQKRLAVQVEDHPLDYATFQGKIPPGQYGAGTVKIWDHGTYRNLLAEKALARDLTQGIDEGRVEVALKGQRLNGRFALIQMKGRPRKNWLLIKMKDEFAHSSLKPEVNLSGASGRAAPAIRRSRSSAANARVQKVEITHADKVLFPDPGITKGEVFGYYRRIAKRLLPYLKDRPVTLERLPDGIGDAKTHFWQKNTPDYYPSWIPRVELPSEKGKPVQYALVQDVESLLYLVNQGTLTFHVGFSRMQNLEHPDFVLFDLDRGEARFQDVVAVARKLDEILKEEGHTSFVKTSGKTGLHVLVPWQNEADFDDARAWALDLAERVAEALPKQATTQRSKTGRQGRVYVDVMQNAAGHHAVPPYVLRAVAGAPVSTPLNWREITDRLDPGRFNLTTIFARLARQSRDPMAPLLRFR